MLYFLSTHSEYFPAFGNYSSWEPSFSTPVDRCRECELSRLCVWLNRFKGFWLCRSGLCCAVKERRPSAARRDEGRHGHVHHQGCAACGRELRLCWWNQEEDERPGQPAAGVQPLGGKAPGPPIPSFSSTDVLLADGIRSSKQISHAIWPSDGPGPAEGPEKADGLYSSRMREPQITRGLQYTHTPIVFIWCKI